MDLKEVPDSVGGRPYSNEDEKAVLSESKVFDKLKTN